MTISPKYLSLLVGLWEQLFKIGALISRLKLSRDSGFSSKIKTITPNSVRLDTLQGSRVWGGGGSRGILPRKKLGIWGLQTAGNAVKLSILASPCYFCIILNILRSHQADLFGSWGGGGGGLTAVIQQQKKTDYYWWMSYSYSLFAHASMHTVYVSVYELSGLFLRDLRLLCSGLVKLSYKSARTVL